MAEFACIAMRGCNVCRDLVCVLLVIWPSLRPFICNVFDFFLFIQFLLCIIFALFIQYSES